MIYGLTSSKGGVGKTTIAVHLAAHLASKKRSVIFIDADPPAIGLRLDQGTLHARPPRNARLSEGIDSSHRGTCRRRR